MPPDDAAPDSGDNETADNETAEQPDMGDGPDNEQSTAVQLNRWKDRARKHEDRAKESRTQLEAWQKTAGVDDPKAWKPEPAKAPDPDPVLLARALKAEVNLAATAAGAVSSKDVAALIGGGLAEYATSDELPEVIASRIEALQEESPYLFAAGRARGSADGGAKNDQADYANPDGKSVGQIVAEQQGRRR